MVVFGSRLSHGQLDCSALYAGTAVPVEEVCTVVCAILFMGLLLPGMLQDVFLDVLCALHLYTPRHSGTVVALYRFVFLSFFPSSNVCTHICRESVRARERGLAPEPEQEQEQERHKENGADVVVVSVCV